MVEASLLKLFSSQVSDKVSDIKEVLKVGKVMETFLKARIAD